jgi:hypothetical protein
MNQEFPIIEVMRVGDGVYRLFSLFDKDNIALTAQAFLELAIWVAANRETLEQEAGQEASQGKPGANMLL